LNYSRKSQEFVWFYWSGTSKGTWVTQGKCNLHPFTRVAQVHFFGCNILYFRFPRTGSRDNSFKEFFVKNKLSFHFIHILLQRKGLSAQM
jgi:hypothetical protein